MVRTLDKRYQLPSPNYFSEVVIPELYKKSHGEVQVEMAHFVHSDFELKSLSLLADLGFPPGLHQRELGLD